MMTEKEQRGEKGTAQHAKTHVYIGIWHIENVCRRTALRVLLLVRMYLSNAK